MGPWRGHLPRTPALPVRSGLGPVWGSPHKDRGGSDIPSVQTDNPPSTTHALPLGAWQAPAVSPSAHVHGTHACLRARRTRAPAHVPLTPHPAPRAHERHFRGLRPCRELLGASRSLPGRGRRVLLTSVRRGSRVTLCMGRIRKEIMGRPPHAGRFSISFRASWKAALLFLQQGTLPQRRRGAGCRRQTMGREQDCAAGLGHPEWTPGRREPALTSASAGHAAGRPRWSSRRRRGGSASRRAPPGCR